MAAYNNPRAAQQGGRAPNPKQNPGGQTRPAYAPKGGSQTPPRPANSGGGRKPDFDVFFAEEATDESGKKVKRVSVGEDGKWLKCAAIWLDPEGRMAPLVRVEADIPAGALLTCRAPYTQKG